MIFELLCILVVLGSIVALVSIVVTAVRGRWRRVRVLLYGYLVCVAVYLGFVIAVARVTPARIVLPGDDRCFDEWCVAVMDATVVRELGEGAGATQAGGQFYVVTIRLSNHARGRSQRVSSAAVRLVDDKGRSYEVSRRGQAAYEAEHGTVAPLTSTIELRQFLDTVRVFDLPVDSKNVGLTIRHPLGRSPGLFIIGDDASLFHKPTIMLLK